MPHRWQSPEKFMEYGGLTVYHTYNDEMVSDIWYTVIEENDDLDSGNEEGQFCVEDIPTSSEINRNDHRAIIQYAIDAGWLTDEGLYLPAELAP